jgi:hypothetical protein
MLFWMARRTVRSCTSGRSSGGAGCAVVILALFVIGGITGGGAQAPVAGPHGWHQGPDGVYIPDNPPANYGTGGPDWAASPAWTGPPLPAYVPPAPAAPPPAPRPAPSSYWALLFLAIPLGILGALAFIGSRMAPKPIWTPPKDGPPDFPPWEQFGGGGPPPPNPARWSDRR